MLSRQTQGSTRSRDVARPFSFPAARRGWIKNESLSGNKAGGAELLDNFVPTTEGVRIRRGSVLHATIAGAVTATMTYDVNSGSKFFVADEGAIYDATNPVDAEVPLTPAVSGQASGEWSSTQFATGGGIFLVAVNGTDPMQRYNGAAWTAVTSAIAGVSTSSLSHVWQFKNRLFFIQAGTLNAWHLDVDSIAGDAHPIALGTIFKLGGELVFGATWSISDTGEGLDDVCLFVTSKGEIAVYTGTDPSGDVVADPSLWALSGVYRIGVPLGKNAHVKVGADLLIITDDGLIPVSQVLSKDRVALKTAALTYPIEEAWRPLARSRPQGLPFSITLWPAENMLVMGIPSVKTTTRFALVCNARTGAWARFTGWDVRVVDVFEEKLFFGTSAGTLIQGEITGADAGEPYTSVMVPRFSDMGNANQKVALHARITARANRSFTPALSCVADYDVSTIGPAPPVSDTIGEDDVWDEAIWNTAVWGSSDLSPKRKVSEWQAVAAVGMALAPVLQITTGRVAAPDAEIIAIDLVNETGDVIA